MYTRKSQLHRTNRSHFSKKELCEVPCRMSAYLLPTDTPSLPLNSVLHTFILFFIDFAIMATQISIDVRKQWLSGLIFDRNLTTLANIQLDASFALSVTITRMCCLFIYSYYWKRCVHAGEIAILQGDGCII